MSEFRDPGAGGSVEALVEEAVIEQKCLVFRWDSGTDVLDVSRCRLLYLHGFDEVESGVCSSSLNERLSVQYRDDTVIPQVQV